MEGMAVFVPFVLVLCKSCFEDLEQYDIPLLKISDTENEKGRPFGDGLS